MSHFRFTVKQVGKHAHIRVWVGDTKAAEHINAGILVFRPEEWSELQKLCLQQSAWIDIVEET